MVGLIIIEIILVLAFSYLLGGFLGGALAAKLKGIDLKRHGSGSMGTTNVLRTMGPIPAVATLAIDVAKGAAAAALGHWTGIPGLDAACGLLVIVGHNWPLSSAFRGGKGIATTLGTLLILGIKAPLILVPIWACVALATGFVSLGSIAAVTCVPVILALFYHGRPGFIYLLLYGILAAVLADYQHRENISRLLQGKEHNLWRKDRS